MTRYAVQSGNGFVADPESLEMIGDVGADCLADAAFEAAHLPHMEAVKVRARLLSLGFDAVLVQVYCVPLSRGD